MAHGWMTTLLYYPQQYQRILCLFLFIRLSEGQFKKLWMDCDTVFRVSSHLAYDGMLKFGGPNSLGRFLGSNPLHTLTGWGSQSGWARPHPQKPIFWNILYSHAKILAHKVTISDTLTDQHLTIRSVHRSAPSHGLCTDGLVPMSQYVRYSKFYDTLYIYNKTIRTSSMIFVRLLDHSEASPICPYTRGLKLGPLSGIWRLVRVEVEQGSHLTQFRSFQRRGPF